MAIINASYEILSDPIKRREHDLWISSQEGTNDKPKKPTIEHPQPKYNDYNQPQIKPKQNKFVDTLIAIVAWIFLISATFWLVSIGLDYEESKSTVNDNYKQYKSEAVQEQPTLPNQTKSSKKSDIDQNPAKNEPLWPKSAGYIKGLPKLNNDGLSTVTVDNSQNNSAVFVKLVTLDKDTTYPVRQFYIPAFGEFTLRDVSTGNYDIRYKDLNTKSLFRSDSFNVEEILTGDGKQFSNITMTLYKTENGNVETYPLSESEF